MDNIYWALTTHQMLSLTLNAAFIFPAIPWGSCSYSHFADEETEVREREVTCPQSYRWKDGTRHQAWLTSQLCALLHHTDSFETSSITPHFVLFWFSYLISKLTPCLVLTMLRYTVAFSLSFRSHPDDLSKYRDSCLVPSQAKAEMMASTEVTCSTILLKFFLSLNVRVHLEPSFMSWNGSLFLI